MKAIKLITLLAIGFGAVACAQQQQQQQQPTPMVAPEPVYDKYGHKVS